MAFSTMAQLRAQLNTALGTSDADVTTWSTLSDRNEYLRMAFRRLWPRMARLVRETVTPLDLTMGYTLTSIFDPVALVILDSTGLERDRVKSWELDVDESADPVVRRLWIPTIDTTTTIRVTGYAPYTVPANSDAATCDLPTMYEHVVITGGVAEAYRAKMNKHMAFEQRATENPTTQETLEQVRTAFLAADTEFRAFLSDYGRNRTAPKRAIKTVR